MPIPKANDMLPDNLVDQFDEDNLESNFEDMMVNRVRTDFVEAKRFMLPFHDACLARYQKYYNASEYVDIRKKNKFPMPYVQHQTDEFVSDLHEKLFYKKRPCTLMGVEETDKEDSEAKQELLDWQDYKDHIKTKVEVALRDVALYRITVAKVDYKKKVIKKIRGYTEPAMGFDELTGGEKPQIVNNEPVMVSKTGVFEEIAFQGPTVKRVDPLNFFITEDKSTIDDEEPVMIRDRVSKKYFDEEYFFNQELLSTEAAAPTGDTQDNTYNKRMIRNLQPDQTSKSNKYEYVEWQAIVNKYKLYEFLINSGYVKDDKLKYYQDALPYVDPRESCLAICGVVNDRIMVRLEDSPFEFGTPNIVVGIMQADENEILGTSLSDKIISMAEGLDELAGILLENFKQSVNAQHVINKLALVSGGSVLVNKAGGVIETNDDPNKVHKRIEQPRLGPDIYNIIDFFMQMGQDAGGRQDAIGGRGEAGAGTLGEFEGIAMMASKRMRNHLESFEESFVEPLYQMRNQINMQFLDESYLYGIISDKVIDWRTIEPGQIRANVDFICESSSRETNRIVITQQILQMIKVAPAAKAFGFPIRFDKLLQQLMELGFSWTTDKSEDILPSLKLEKEYGLNIDALLMSNMLIGLQNQAVQGLMDPMGTGLGGNGGAPGFGGMPQPTSEQGAREGANSRNRTNIGKVQ